MSGCSNPVSGRGGQFRLLGALLVAAGVSSVAAPPLGAAVLIPVPPAPGASTTTAYAINDDGVIAGSFIGASDGIEHSFFGTLDGTYVVFDAGTGGSEARGIGNDGVITGFSNSQAGESNTEPMFERSVDGTISSVTRSGQPLYGLAQGLDNARDQFAGTYWDTHEFEGVAFLGRKAKWRHDVHIPVLHEASSAAGINSSGVIVGSFISPPEPRHGYLASGHKFALLDYPSDNSVGTILEGINDRGGIVGQWIDTAGTTHSFLFDQFSNTFTDIKVRGASWVQAWGINSRGMVPVSTDIGSFIWCARKRDCRSTPGRLTLPVNPRRS